MTLKEIRNKYNSSLSSRYSKKEAESLFFIILDHRLKINRIQYLSDSMFEISDEDKTFLLDDLHQLKAGKPWQYMTGEVEFCGLSLSVDHNTLIPRPETEELVYYIRQELKAPPLSILDVGTGSGCLAIALKHFYPDANVMAVDIAQGALAVARRNADKLNLSIDFTEVDILKQNWVIERKFDLIVSNPPYIHKNEAIFMEEQVLAYEPHEALFVESSDPIVFYRVIKELASLKLNKGGYFFAEINRQYGKDLLRLFSGSRWESEIEKDLSGNERFLKAHIV